MTSENVLFEIVIGTYEKFLLGYGVEIQSDAFIMKPSFSVEAHHQTVKCIASSAKYLASGSTDETIQLFNMNTRKEMGALLHHNGSVTSLTFHGSYLISCSEDNTICLWSTNNWECLKTLQGHKSGVNCISVHPSGKMALSVSKDKTLRTWNLIKGRSAYVTNIKKDAELVQWSPDGSFFLISHRNIVEIFSVENAAVLHTIDFQHKICDITFLNDDVFAVAGEQDEVHLFSVKSGSLCNTIKAKTNRIKAVKAVKVNEESFLVTASSEGHIKVWHIDDSKPEWKIHKVGKVSTGCRPTCMTIIVKTSE
ncbi:p21-activated protein kinase-interacting protein 1-like [Uloborus diversus]|uniref:p21-activated protein kinase-interacting protein 1-like n=1 Tax=Uloborus diversus TaxID=327109 RepID=UPI00240A6A3A|nr:p21-activated protein kinase-interacting protein 1-like [Uloborus diversus]